MTEKEQIDAFSDDIDRLITRYADEFDLSRAAAVGTLMFALFNIMADARESHQSGDDETPT